LIPEVGIGEIRQESQLQGVAIAVSLLIIAAWPAAAPPPIARLDTGIFLGF
jgi:hypothetical protein